MANYGPQKGSLIAAGMLAADNSGSLLEPGNPPSKPVRSSPAQFFDDEYLRLKRLPPPDPDDRPIGH
jgi:hypothetical protein